MKAYSLTIRVAGHMLPSNDSKLKINHKRVLTVLILAKS